MAAAQPIRATPIPETARNAARTPTRPPSAPITGPISAPKTAAPIAVPSISPRRSRGAAPTIQASPPAHEKTLPKPCTNRASASVQLLPASAKPRLEIDIRVRPISTARLGPRRDVTTPPGIAPTSAPAA